jgi:hypothetical protein
MLTGDQNIIDIAYQVRWLIRDPEQFPVRIGRAGRDNSASGRKLDEADRRAGDPAGRHGREAR